MSHKIFNEPEQTEYLSWKDVANFALAIFIFGVTVGVLLMSIFE